MGCCCSVDAVALRAERNASNPKEAHGDWASRLLADIGSDVQAVSRDFPRMQVCLRDPDVENEDRPDVVVVKGMQATTRQRHEKVIRNIVSIAALCGEGDTVGKQVQSWLDNALASNLALLEQPDACPVMRQLQTEAGLIAPVPLSHEPTEDPAPSPVMHPVCKTFRVLEYLVQGIVFYPVQRLSYLFWFPWSTRVTDFEWHSFVCTRPQFPEHVYVIHRQVSRNYVDKKDAATTPHFEFEWDLVIAVKAATGDLDDAHVDVRRVSLLSGGNLVDRCGGASSDAQWMRDRVDQLAQRVMDSFDVELKKA